MSVLYALGERINSFDKDDLLHIVSDALCAEMKDRVFNNGTASDNSQIGNYTSGYMKVRTGNYPNAPIATKGKDKGNFKIKKVKVGDAGIYTKGINKGKPRVRYNRAMDTKVILSLTREMENDMKTMPTEDGWGIGFSNVHNYNKAKWNASRYGKSIWILSEEENRMVSELANKRIQEVING